MIKEILAGLIIWLAFFAVLTWGWDASAQTRAERETLLLARTCVAETGLDSRIEECLLMWTVNQANANRKGVTLARQTKLFNAYWRSTEQRARRPWIAHLGGRTRPDGWPLRASWKRNVEKWLNIERAAEAFVYSHRQYWFDCKGVVDYGSPFDRPRDQRLVKVQCLDGDTKQHYWARK